MPRRRGLPGPPTEQLVVVGGATSRAPCPTRPDPVAGTAPSGSDDPGRLRRRAEARRRFRLQRRAPGIPRLGLRPLFGNAPGSGKDSRAATRVAIRRARHPWRTRRRSSRAVSLAPYGTSRVGNPSGESLGRWERDLGLPAPRAPYGIRAYACRARRSMTISGCARRFWKIAMGVVRAMRANAPEVPVRHGERCFSGGIGQPGRQIAVAAAPVVHAPRVETPEAVRDV